MVYTVKKRYDVWVVLDSDGNEIEECPARKDAVKCAAYYNVHGAPANEEGD